MKLHRKGVLAIGTLTIASLCTPVHSQTLTPRQQLCQEFQLQYTRAHHMEQMFGLNHWRLQRLERELGVNLQLNATDEADPEQLFRIRQNLEHSAYTFSYQHIREDYNQTSQQLFGASRALLRGFFNLERLVNAVGSSADLGSLIIDPTEYAYLLTFSTQGGSAQFLVVLNVVQSMDELVEPGRSFFPKQLAQQSRDYMRFVRETANTYGCSISYAQAHVSPARYEPTRIPLVDRLTRGPSCQ